MGRSWSKPPSAIAPSRAPGVVVLVADGLVGEVAAGHHQHPRAPVARSTRAPGRKSRWCSGVYGRRTPEVGVAGRDSRRHGARPGDRRSRTIGPLGAGEEAGLAPASTSASRLAAARSATITANGFSARCLRWRSSSTAAARGGIAGQVVSAEALDRHDLARPPAPAGPRPGRRLRRAMAPPADPRTTAEDRTPAQATGWA